MAVGTGAHLRDVKCEDQMALMCRHLQFATTHAR
ncbi:hypothetical protein M3J09_008936 [Ascochyta lentis]